MTQPSDSSPPDLPEMRVVEWLAEDDGVDPNRYEEFFDDDRFSQLYDEGLLDAVPLHTRVGGLPHWIQSFQNGPPKPWRFVLQLWEWQRGDGPEPTPDETGWGLQRVLREWSPGERQDVRFEYPDEMGPGDTRVRLEVSGST